MRYAFIPLAMVLLSLVGGESTFGQDDRGGFQTPDHDTSTATGRPNSIETAGLHVEASAKSNLLPEKLVESYPQMNAQRKRIDRFIEATSNMGIEEATNSLNENGEFYGLVTLASLSSSDLGTCFFNQVVADRRASKIFEYLLSLSGQEASAEASRIFDEKICLMVENWQQMAANNSASLGHLGRTGPDHHAASVAILLCSYFCDPHKLDEKLTKWDNAMNQREFHEIQGVQYLRRSRFIDPLFRLNLIVISGTRNGKSIESLSRTLDEVAKEGAESPNPRLKVSSRRLFKWNAETLDTDFTHITRGAPASGDSILLELPFLSDANSHMHFVDPQRFVHLEQTISKWRKNGGSE